MLGQTIHGAVVGSKQHEPLIVASMKYAAERIRTIEKGAYESTLGLVLVLLEQEYDPSLTPHILSLTSVVIQVLLE